MSEEPPNCPFCGGTADQNESHTWCMNCEANASRGDWRHRPIEDALRARIGELEGAISKANEFLGNGMSKPEFTPGPWEYDILGKEGVCVVIFGKDKLPLASLYHNPRKNTEQKANANLIAAAPKMYELLFRIYSVDPKSIVCLELISKIPELLKEARGEK